jgi:hypothetical protein
VGGGGEGGRTTAGEREKGDGEREGLREEDENEEHHATMVRDLTEEDDLAGAERKDVDWR